MDTVADAVRFAQRLVDPTGQGLFRDDFLLAYAEGALRELRGEITSPAVTSLKAVTMIPALPIGTADLDAYMAPGGVLASLEVPTTIREKPAGYANESYTEVVRVEELPARESASRLLVYEWTGGRVLFIPATQALDLEVRYRAAWAPVKAMTDALPLPGLVPALGWRIASSVATALGQGPDAIARLARAKELLHKWINTRVMESQRTPRRPMPFRRMGAQRRMEEGDEWV